MKLLIIDDNPDITKLVSNYMAMNNHECHTANDGRNGLNLIENQRYDIILLDLAMPSFSGSDIIYDLAKKGKLQKQKVVIFTASSKPDSEIDELLNLGVHSCLKKPIDPDELVSYLENIANGKLTH